MYIERGGFIPLLLLKLAVFDTFMKWRTREHAKVDRIAYPRLRKAFFNNNPI